MTAPPPEPTSPRPDLLDLSRGELRDHLGGLGEPAYRGDQVFRWMWQRGARSFEAMTDLPLALRAALAASAVIAGPVIERADRSVDGTVKLLIGLRDGTRVESVVIPEGDRRTLCVSTQVGCALACAFCATGTLGLTRHLRAGEIAAQLLLAQAAVRGDPAAAVADPGDRTITNIVYMGMGEPLHNMKGTLGSLEILTDESAFGMAPRRITVSTVGLVKEMLELGERVPVNLAVSLHAGDDATRARLMPVNRRHDLRAVLDACRRFPLAARRRITFEYVLLAGVNDAVADADRLADALGDLQAKVNVIPFNPHPGAAFSRPGADAVERFTDRLRERDVPVFVRTPRGDDIAAACGQLAGAAAGAGPASAEGEPQGD